MRGRLVIKGVHKFNVRIKQYVGNDIDKLLLIINNSSTIFHCVGTQRFTNEADATSNPKDGLSALSTLYQKKYKKNEIQLSKPTS